jgi:hypothetical protein
MKEKPNPKEPEPQKGINLQIDGEKLFDFANNMIDKYNLKLALNTAGIDNHDTYDIDDEHKRWKTPIDDQLLNSVDLALEIEDSEPGSSRCYSILFLEFSEEAIKAGKVWNIPKNVAHIGRKLEEQGFKLQLSRDRDLGTQFIIRNEEDDSVNDALVQLGFSSPEDAEEAEQYFTEDSNYYTGIEYSLGVQLEGDALSLSEDNRALFKKNIQHLEKVAGIYINSLYECFNIQPPNKNIQFPQNN